MDVNALFEPNPAQTGLHVAVKMGHMPLVQMLLDNKRVDLMVKNGEGKDALELAVEAGKSQMKYTFFLKRGKKSVVG